jgi:small subunit ribosomal protein S4
MGEIKRKKSKFKRPKDPFDKSRIDEENAIVEKYGLKNKKEIWRAEAMISKIRKQAKSLIKADGEEQKEFFERLNKFGFKTETIPDVLDLAKENWLDRRLQTFVFKKKLANTPKQARQLITHKHVLVNGSIVKSPSFVITADLEDKLMLVKKDKAIKERKVAETKTKVAEQPKEVEAQISKVEQVAPTPVAVGENNG